jgi:hypothetical protein
MVTKTLLQVYVSSRSSRSSRHPCCEQQTASDPVRRARSCGKTGDRGASRPSGSGLGAMGQICASESTTHVLSQQALCVLGDIVVQLRRSHVTGASRRTAAVARPIRGPSYNEAFPSVDRQSLERLCCTSNRNTLLRMRLRICVYSSCPWSKISNLCRRHGMQTPRHWRPITVHLEMRYNTLPTSRTEPAAFRHTGSLHNTGAIASSCKTSWPS